MSSLPFNSGEQRGNKLYHHWGQLTKPHQSGRRKARNHADSGLFVRLS